MPCLIAWPTDLLSTFSSLQDQTGKIIQGHRIIDINHFFEQFVEISQHQSLFQCGLSTMHIKSEKRCGLQSQLTIICKLCKKKFKVTTTPEDLNKMAVTGVLAAGCGRAQLNQFSSSLDLPTISNDLYVTTQDEVYDEWEVTAWDEMRKAGIMEKEAALNEGRVTQDGTPIIDVILDGCWCKRSYKTNYSALSGAATKIGRRSGKVLFMAVKNKYCCICARAQKRNDTPKPHEYQNYSGASTSMESCIIFEGFKQSIAMHGVIYGRFIADGDSSTYAKILETRPYDNITVEKIGCRNHILRNFCNKMQNLKVETKYAIKDRKLLTNNTILSARKYICDAIKYHNSQEEKSSAIKKLHQDLAASIYHGFGQHAGCNKELCKEETTIDMTTFLTASCGNGSGF